MEPPVSTQAVDTQVFLQDVLHGLNKPHRSLPSKYFYDERGSQLFDQICELDEYYLTRTETAIMQRHAAEMADQLGTQVMLLEFGSGSSTKSLFLLDEIRDPVAYVPIDISEEHLLKTARQLQKDYPHLEVLPLVADFTRPLTLPIPRRRPSHRAVYFPGSTIGNFMPETARSLIARIANMLGKDGGLLIGIDLQKDVQTLIAAYDDSQGVTREFNLNLLHRINAELGADFIVDQFQHLAEYNQQHHRIEIFAVSLCDQTVSIGDRQFSFKLGERILTEYSHKYTVQGFAELAAAAGGFTLHRWWTDDNQLFAVLHLVKETD